MIALQAALVDGHGMAAEALIKHIPGFKPDVQCREVGVLL